MSNNNYKGACFCGDIEFDIEGSPEAMAYCHCESCRQWSAGPVSAFTLWKPEKVTITKGADNMAMFDQNPLSGDAEVVSKRAWCKTCGGHVYTDHPTMGVIDIPAAVIDKFNFKPAFHVHYQESVHTMKDGLPKFRDLPAEAGGSGEQIAE